GLVFDHVVADYTTRYAYGERGVAAVAALLRRSARPGDVVAPHPVTFALGVPFWNGGAEFWRGERGRHAEVVRSERTSELVWSVAHHEVAQLRYATTEAGLAAALAAGGYRSA